MPSTSFYIRALTKSRAFCTVPEMIVDKSKCGLTFKHPRMTRTSQEIKLREAGAQWIVHVGKTAQTWQDVAKQVEPGDVLYICAGCMVPAPVAQMGMTRPGQWAAWMTEVHKRGGTVFEVLTGRKSHILKDQKAMNDETVRLLKRSGAPLPGAATTRGRKRSEWPSVEVRNQAFLIWVNKDFPSDAAAIRNAPAGVSERMMRSFGPSGRK